MSNFSSRDKERIVQLFLSTFLYFYGKGNSFESRSQNVVLKQKIKQRRYG